MKQKQQGLVLFVALIFLVILAVLGISLVANSTMDARMAGSAAERTEALQQSNGMLDNTILHASTNQVFISPEPNYGTGGLSWAASGAQPTLTTLKAETSCGRKEKGNDTSAFACRHLETTAPVEYGRKNAGRIASTYGVEQPVIGKTGS
ncbi:pilus assembly PilX N-terminal domain-containing protein [Gallaecimonas sp. GXIMD4217]|uniref:pilus assembly PilX family protein n=1 Tax=Gallaecimonas sp. GXIMD4217 TaxID=3131927 RepID=UPI00311B1F6D